MKVVVLNWVSLLQGCNIKLKVRSCLYWEEGDGHRLSHMLVPPEVQAGTSVNAQIVGANPTFNKQTAQVSQRLIDQLLKSTGDIWSAWKDS